MSTANMQTQLHIQRGIEHSLNQVLQEMQDLVDSSRIYESRMEIHQMSNLVSVATETPSVEVVKKYVLYQVGRDERNNSWRWRVGSAKNFGERLVEQLDWLKDVAEGVVNEAEGGPKDVDWAWMQLARLHAGHLRRYFYYLKKKKMKGGRR